MPTSAVVLLSGGQDSTTCLFWAKRRFDVIHTVSFRYGQRHESELEAAERIAVVAGVSSSTILDVQALAQLGGSALVGPGEIRASGGMSDRETPNGLPTSFVPGRNLVFLGLAAARAAQVGAQSLVIGVSQTDYSGYPDCRRSFIDTMQAAVDAAMSSSTGTLTIETPLMDLDKTATVKLARDLGDDCWEALGLSVTCYEGQRPGCGKCPACILRATGFCEARLKDPAWARALFTAAQPRRTFREAGLKDPACAPRFAQVGDWVWSSDGEIYGDAFASREAAINDAVRELEGEAFYLARVMELADGVEAIKTSIDKDTIRDVASDYLYEKYGLEDSDNRWHASSNDVWGEIAAVLRDAVDEWGREKSLRVCWYAVSTVETIIPSQLSLEGLR